MENYILNYNQFILENSNNRLITVYHATNKNFKQFDITKASVYNLYGQGIYFTDNLTIAKSYLGGVLSKETADSHIKECILDISNYKNIKDKIEDSDIENLYQLVYNNLVIEDDYDFWFKRIYALNIPKKWDKLGLTPELVNRKELTSFAKKISKPSNGYFSEGYLTWYDVIGIITDDFQTIHSKEIILSMMKEKYNLTGWIIETTGDGLSKDKTTDHNIYCCFDLNTIKNCKIKKEDI